MWVIRGSDLTLSTPIPPQNKERNYKDRIKYGQTLFGKSIASSLWKISKTIRLFTKKLLLKTLIPRTITLNMFQREELELLILVLLDLSRLMIRNKQKGIVLTKMALKIPGNATFSKQALSIGEVSINSK